MNGEHASLQTELRPGQFKCQLEINHNPLRAKEHIQNIYSKKRHISHQRIIGWLLRQVKSERSRMTTAKSLRYCFVWIGMIRMVTVFSLFFYGYDFRMQTHDTLMESDISMPIHLTKQINTNIHRNHRNIFICPFAVFRFGVWVSDLRTG